MNSNYIFLPDGSFISTDEFYHHGVLGMKWGVRRYQNKDGTLTALGKHRVSEGASPFPKYKGKNLRPGDKRAKNRDETERRLTKQSVEDEKREYEKYVKDHPEFNANMQSAKDYWKANLRDKDATTSKQKAEAKRFLDEYSNATLKDLGIAITPEAKEYAEYIIRETWTWMKFDD